MPYITRFWTVGMARYQFCSSRQKSPVDPSTASAKWLSATSEADSVLVRRYIDARFEDPFLPFLNLKGASDFSRYPTFKTSNANPSTLYERTPRARGRITLFTYSGLGSPSSKPRNVSEPQLISSTNYMRESWFTNLASTRTVADIAHLSSDDALPAIHRDQSAAVTCETPGDRSSGEVDNDLQRTPHTVCKDSCDVSRTVKPRACISEEDSFYSMDSADQEAHPLLLSMPIIPLIKLQRKATVMKPDPVLLSDAMHNQSFLSPRIRDFRASAGTSSRRHGCIHPRSDPSAVVSDARSRGHGVLSFWTSLRLGTKSAYTRSVSEPTLNAAYPSDDEEAPLLKKETSDSADRDALSSTSNSADSATEPNNDRATDELPRGKQVPFRHSVRRHRRSFVAHSISLSNIIHAVAEGCASLDLLLRSKPKPKSTNDPKLPERGTDPHDPTSRWAPKHGQIIIKVFVPSTDDIWMFRVPQDINLGDFTSRVVSKLGFSVFFSGSVWDEPRYYFRKDERFRAWVKGRVRFGRNLPIVAHVPPPLPLVRLSVDGCELWCDA